MKTADNEHNKSVSEENREKMMTELEEQVATNNRKFSSFSQQLLVLKASLVNLINKFLY